MTPGVRKCLRISPLWSKLKGHGFDRKGLNTVILKVKSCTMIKGSSTCMQSKPQSQLSGEWERKSCGSKEQLCQGLTSGYQNPCLEMAGGKLPPPNSTSSSYLLADFSLPWHWCWQFIMSCLSSVGPFDNFNSFIRSINSQAALNYRGNCL